MDALSGVASVVSIVTLALQSTKVIYEVGSSISHGSDDIDRLVRATDNLKKLLEVIKRLAVHAERTNSVAEGKLLEDLKQPVEHCASALSDISVRLLQLQKDPKDRRWKKAKKSARVYLDTKGITEIWNTVNHYVELLGACLGNASVDIGLYNAQEAQHLHDELSAASRDSKDRFHQTEEIFRDQRALAEAGLNAFRAELHRESVDARVAAATQIQGIADILAEQQQCRENITVGYERIADLQVDVQDLRAMVDDRSHQASLQSEALITGVRSGISEVATSASGQVGRMKIEVMEKLRSISDRVEPAPSMASEQLSILQNLVGMISGIQLEMRSGRQERQNTIRSKANLAEIDRSRDLEGAGDPEIEMIMQRICQFARTMTKYRHSKNAQSVIEDIGQLLGLVMQQCGATSISRDELPRKRKTLCDYHYSELEMAVQTMEDLAKAKRVLTASERVRLIDKESWPNNDFDETESSFSGRSQNRPVPNTRGRWAPMAHIRDFPQSWELRHSRLDASFKTMLMVDKEDNNTESADEAFAAKVVVTPTTTTLSNVQIIVDLASRTYRNRTVHLIPTLTFRAMIPDDSEVFRVVQRGSVKKLKKLLSSGAASLGDCDPAGRSLLNYALGKCRRTMAAFLIQSGADVDTLESPPGTDPSVPWDITLGKPLNIVGGGVDSAISGEDLERVEGCYKLLLDAGSDLTSIALCPNSEGNYWSSAYSLALEYGSFVKLKALIDMGEPFISLESTGDDNPLATIPLQLLAHCHCGLWKGGCQTPDKIALLLSRGANVEARNHGGETSLHVLFQNLLTRDDLARRYYGDVETQSYLSESMDILILICSAGADVCAIDDQGRSVSDVAFNSAHEVAWTKALKYCGIDINDVLARPNIDSARSTALSSPYNKGPKVTSKLSLAEYLNQRIPRARTSPYFQSFHDFSSSEDDDSENGDRDRDESEYGDWDYESENEDYDDDDDEIENEDSAEEMNEISNGTKANCMPENGQSDSKYKEREKAKLD